MLVFPAGSKDLMAGSLDIHVTSLSDCLIDGMSFANRPTASYITGRKSTSFPTQSGGTFASSNLRIMRFNMADSDGAWADGGTMRVCFTIQNNGSIDSAHHAFARLLVQASTGALRWHRDL